MVTSGVLSVLVGLDDPASGDELRLAIEAAGHAVMVCGALEVGQSGWPATPDVLLVDGDSPALELGVLWAGWGKRQPPPVLLVLTGSPEIRRAAQKIGAQVILKPTSATRLASEIGYARAEPGAPAVNPSAALRLLHKMVGGAPEDEAQTILAGAARAPLATVREALRPLAHCYLAVTPLFETLRARGVLDADTARFALAPGGARTLRRVIDSGGWDAERAARLLWALLCGGVLIARGEPRLDAPEPLERLTARFRAHVRARAQRRGASGWQVLEIEPGAPSEDVERAAQAFAVRYAPERWQALDLGGETALAEAVWKHVLWARATLTEAKGRAAHDLRFPRPINEDVKRRQTDANDAEQAFLRGQRALAAGDHFKAVSELAAAARRFPDEPAHDAYAAWARVVAEAARGGDKRKHAARERAALEDATWGKRPGALWLLALGLLCDAAGDDAFARLHLQEALALDRHFAQAQKALELLGPG